MDKYMDGRTSEERKEIEDNAILNHHLKSCIYSKIYRLQHMETKWLNSNWKYENGERLSYKGVYARDLGKVFGYMKTNNDAILLNEAIEEGQFQLQFWMNENLDQGYFFYDSDANYLEDAVINEGIELSSDKEKALDHFKKEFNYLEIDKDFKQKILDITSIEVNEGEI